MTDLVFRPDADHVAPLSQAAHGRGGRAEQTTAPTIWLAHLTDVWSTRRLHRKKASLATPFFPWTNPGRRFRYMVLTGRHTSGLGRSQVRALVVRIAFTVGR
jgi:hypothetical protein